MERRMPAALAALAVAVLVAACGGDGSVPDPGASGVPPTSTGPTTTDAAAPGVLATPAPEPSETEVVAPCATPDALRIEHGDPVPASDLFAEGHEKSWRHEVPVTLTSAVDVDCFFEIQGTLEGDITGEGSAFVRYIALRAGQTARLADFPDLDDRVAFDAPGTEDGRPTAPWEVVVKKTLGEELVGGYYDHEIVRLEPRVSKDSPFAAGLWPMYAAHTLDGEVAVAGRSAVAAEHPEPRALPLGGVMIDVVVNGLDASGDVVAYWRTRQAETDTVKLEMPSLGGGVRDSWVGRPDLFFVDEDALAAVVEYDLVMFQPSAWER